MSTACTLKADGERTPTRLPADKSDRGVIKVGGNDIKTVPIKGEDNLR